MNEESSSAADVRAPRRRGRRPGGQSSRGDVLRAAGDLFASVGFEKATLRAIAAEAGVDSAQVVQFFKSKDGLFTAVLEGLDLMPPTLLARATHAAGPSRGSEVARTYLRLWEAPETGLALRVLVRGAVGSPQALKLTQAYLDQRVFASPRPHLAAIGGMLFGVAIVRYIVQTGPLATMTLGELSAMLEPSIDVQLTHELDDPRPTDADPRGHAPELGNDAER